MDSTGKDLVQPASRKRLFASFDEQTSDVNFVEIDAKKSRFDANSNKRDHINSFLSAAESVAPFSDAGSYRREVDEQQSKILHRAPSGPYVSCRSEFSLPVYFKVRAEISDAELEASLGKLDQMESLLFNARRDPNDLQRREAIFDAVRDATYRKLELAANERNSDLAQCDDDGINHASQTRKKSSVHSNALWLDRYSPKRYLDLVSDEQINRRVLRWLKTWDSVVYSSKSNRNSAGDAAKLNSASSFEDQFSRLDDRGAPFWKVLVLVGVPGCGKTTLAHVAARHAGYLPIEVNASDDRSTTVFRERLESALEFRSALPKSKSAFGGSADQDKSESLPICLIFDEIDGAPPASVRILVDRIKADSTPKTARASNNADSGSDSGESDSETPAAKSKTPGSKNEPSSSRKKRTKPIRRPIIAICNDLYATSLKTLRKVALVVRCGVPDTRALVDRLAQIAISERVLLNGSDGRSRVDRLDANNEAEVLPESESEDETVATKSTTVDRAVLEKVARLHNYDIRSSLNALQFVIATSNKCENDGSSLGSDKRGVDALLDKLASMSQKDAQESASNNLFQIGNVLFNISGPGGTVQPRRPNARTPAAPCPGGVERTFNALAGYFDSVLFGGHDQLERLLFTAFENYAHLPLRDTFMQKLALIADAFCFNEEISNLVFASQCYALQAYHSLTFVLIAFIYTANRVTRFGTAPPKGNNQYNRNRSVPNKAFGGQRGGGPATGEGKQPFGKQSMAMPVKNKPAFPFNKPAQFGGKSFNPANSAAANQNQAADSQSQAKPPATAEPVDRVRYPVEWYEFRSTLDRNRSLVGDWHSEFYRSLPTKDTRSRQYRSASVDITDFIPYLVRLIQPKIRPINVQLFTTVEKRELSRVIEAMLTYNLEYKQVLEADAKLNPFSQTGTAGRSARSLEDDEGNFGADDQRPPPAFANAAINKYTYVLDPDLESLVKFSPVTTIKSANPYVQSGGGSLTYTAKQVIAREMEVERLRKHAAVELNADVNIKPVDSSTNGMESSGVETKPSDVLGEKKTVEPVTGALSVPNAGRWQLPTLKSQFKPNLDGQTGENAPASSILRWVLPKAKTDEKRNAESKS